MIGSLRGVLLDRGIDGTALVEVAGVGYRVHVHPGTAVALGDEGVEVFLHVHHHMREDHQALYGFLHRDERRCFEILLGAHGVGPALAMAILGVHPPGELQRVLADDDLAALCLVPGVGKKTAARLLVELKARMQVPDLDLRATGSAAGPAAPPSVRADVREALAGLGYGPDEIASVVADLPADGDAATLVKEALKRLAVAR
jgi:Holliday junction DNA helicase RuvA